MALLLACFAFLYHQLAPTAMPSAIMVAASDDGEGNDDQEDQPQNINRFADNPMPQSPHNHPVWSDEESENQEESLLFSLNRLNISANYDTRRPEIVAFSGEAIDLDTGNIMSMALPTATSNSNSNSSSAVQFHIYPLRGHSDVVFLHSDDGILAARIPRAQHATSRTEVIDTVTELVTLAISDAPGSETISWILNRRSGRSRSYTDRSFSAYFIISNGDAAVIRGSRVPNGVPRNTYSVYHGRFRLVRDVFDLYFELRRVGHDMEDPALRQLTVVECNLNGERELLISCSKCASGVDGGLFVRDRGETKRVAALC